MKIKLYIVLLIVTLAAAGCRLIDDDLSVCGVDYSINYQMRLTTEIQLTIEEELSSEIEKSIAEKLKLWSEPYFSGQAHDLDMSFFSLDGDDELKHHQFEIIDANRKSYTLTIPREDYQHLAVVNIVDNKNVQLQGALHSRTMHIEQRDMDTIPLHSTAIFTARLPMRIPKDTDITFDVHLYMVSSAVALVALDTLTGPTDTKPVLQRVLLSGCATDFNVLDSTYSFAHPSVIEAERVTDQCFAMVSFPSRDFLQSGAGAPLADGGLWELRAYVQMPDGKITENVLSIRKPLKAGRLEIVKVYLHDDGSVEPDVEADVGVSVTLDWKDGGTHELITG